MATDADVATRAWLVKALEENSAWRRMKADEYADDPRNDRAAVALRTAALYLRLLKAPSPGLRRMSKLVSAAEESGIDLLAPGDVAVLPGPESQRVATRYFFDNGDSVPDDRSHEELLEQIYKASLVDLRDHLAEVEQDSALARLLAEEGPAARVDPVVGLLTEIRDLLRERLPAEGTVASTSG